MNKINKIFTVFFTVLLFSTTSFGQINKKTKKQIVFTGIVFKYESFSVFDSVSILKNGKLETQTDSCGIFQLAVKPNDTLIFTVNKIKNGTFVIPQKIKPENYIMSVMLHTKKEKYAQVFYKINGMQDLDKSKRQLANKPNKAENLRDKFKEKEDNTFSVKRVNDEINKFLKGQDYKNQSGQHKSETLNLLTERTLLFVKQHVQENAKKQKPIHARELFLKE